MDNFVYDVPYVYDFTSDLGEEDLKKTEAFFEIEHEMHNGGVQQLETMKSINDSERELEQDFYTPMKSSPETPNAVKCLRTRLRKSLSMGNLPTDISESTKPSDEVDTISNAMENLRMSGKKKSGRYFDGAQRGNRHNMTTRASAPKLNFRSRSISREHIEKLAQAKRKDISHEDLHVQKYISMAEAINQFQQKTPKRFHTKAKTDFASTTKAQGPLQNTVPQSPALATKQRVRPTSIMSREEQELKEYEEIKRYKIKANPVNAKILTGPVQLKPPSVLKKPVTKLEPFNLTEVPVKKAPTSPKPQLFHFHAKPLSKSVLEPPKPIIKSTLFTHPQTPNLMKRYARTNTTKNEIITKNGVGKTGGAQPFKPIRTMPAPFSFEERDKDIKKKREQLINEVLEEEKKAREFHAKPIPKSIFKSPQATNTSTYYQKRQRSEGSIYKSTEDSLFETSTFKARPAKVLQMKPFEPKKDDQHLIEISEFQLNTIRRAKEREEFQQKKKEKEEKMAQIIKQNEEEMLRREEEEMLRLRKEAEYKAQPIRRYKEVKPVASKQLTAPVSPKFVSEKNKRKEQLINKENSIDNSSML